MAKVLKILSENSLVLRQGMEMLGKKLAKFTDKEVSIQGKNLQDLDLTKITAELKNSKSAFHEQIPHLSKKLFGTTPIGKYGDLAGKVVSKSTLEQLSDGLFLQIAKLAQTWAEFDLKHDPRFINLQNLTDDSERQALAQTIAHQNRSLAVLGGISNAVGIKGIFIDTLWLLTISLRSIFQIAHIYQQPLTGKQGIQIAYDILSRSNLNQLQEKQTLLAGLGIMEMVSNHPINPNPTVQTNKQLQDTESIQDYLQKIVEISQQMNFNLQTLNFKFLNKILPMTSIAIGVTFNNVIINEVIQIAMATFAPKPKLIHGSTVLKNDDMS